MALQVLPGPVIEAGYSLSNGLDCTGGDIIRITMPSVWTGANLSFQISTNGADYNDLHRADGSEVVIPVVPGSAVVLSYLGDSLKAFAFLKVRSGTKRWPVPQEARRQFSVSIDTTQGPKEELPVISPGSLPTGEEEDGE